MSGTNQFKAFATGGGANTLSPSAYAALTTLIGSGFQSGLASSQQMNTVLRQTSFMAAAIAQLIANAGMNANDDGDLTTLAANLATMFQSLGSPTGQIIILGASSPPTGFLECNGAAISRSTYSALFGAVSTAFGVGDGSTTFNIPDFRGYFPRGWDHGRGIDSGRTFGSAQSDAYGSHNHPISDPNHSHSTDLTLTGGYVGGGAHSWQAGGQLATSGTSSEATGITVSSSGGTETRPKNLAILFGIKY